MSQGQRKLAAIMFTDMVGYTLLGQRNESLSLALVEEQRRLVRPVLARHGGKEVKTIGDAFLIDFSNTLDAVRCAYDIQRTVREFNLSLEEGRRIHLRIGVHVGEVVESQGDISGDAVNVASRIEPLAEDGGVCLSRQVYDHVRNKLDLRISSIGPRTLKNVAEPVEVYKVAMPWEQDGHGEQVPSEMNRVAILPFTNMSPDPNDGYFADGMTEELIDRLAQVKELKVIARTSVMKYKGSQKGAMEVGKELSAGTLVEGSVRKAGNRVRVTVQLIKADTEDHLWSSHYDKDLDDIFAVQSEIAEKVAGELQVVLTGSEKEAVKKKPTENTDAYRAFLRGRELLRKEKDGPVREALSNFEKAIEIDPAFAKAYVGIAECHQFLATAGYEPRDQSIPIVRTSLEGALRLDPDLPEAHASMALLLYNEDDLKGTEAEARKALELNPSLTEPYHVLFEIAATKGKIDEAVGLIETAYRLDPVKQSYIALVGTTYFWTGREKEALEHWRKTEELAPAFTYRSLAEYYMVKGGLAQAREYLAKFAALEPTHIRVLWMEGAIAALSGDREGALRAVKKIEDLNAGPIALNFIGFIYHTLGDLDKYFDYMNRALDEHTIIPVYVLYFPLLAAARADPRWPALVERLRF